MSTAFDHSLLCHPTARAPAVRTVQVSAKWLNCGALALSYRIEGHPDAILIPAGQAPAAVDGLWQQTCCEAFMAAVDGKKYLEFNFSPSGQWANYRFIDYRDRDPGFTPPAPPQITFRHQVDGFVLDALLTKNLLPTGAALNIGLAVIIEMADRSKNYWALKHCAEQPDFHLRQSFALTLPTLLP